MKLTTNRSIVTQSKNLLDRDREALLNLKGLNVCYDDDDVDLRIILENLEIPDHSNDPDHHNIHLIFSLLDITNEPLHKLKHQIGAHIYAEYINIFELDHPEDLRPRKVLETTIDYCIELIDIEELSKVSELALEAYEVYHKKYNFSFNSHVTFFSDETMAFAAYELAAGDLSNLVTTLEIAVKRYAIKEFKSIKQMYQKALYEKDQLLRHTVRNNFKPGSFGHVWLPGLTTSDKDFDNRWEEAEDSFIKDQLNLYYINLRKIIRLHLLY